MSCYRTLNPLVVRMTTDKYADTMEGFVPETWLATEGNVCITNSDGDIGLLQFVTNGVYFVHTYFNSRGRIALDNCHEMLKKAFSEYGVKAMQGLTPLERKASRWFNRKLGFTSHGTIETAEGPCELFILTREEYNGSLRR